VEIYLAGLEAHVRLALREVLEQAELIRNSSGTDRELFRKSGNLSVRNVSIFAPK
jgi:hypothetical protein